jgi:hypothetical protein
MRPLSEGARISSIRPVAPAGIYTVSPLISGVPPVPSLSVYFPPLMEILAKSAAHAVPGIIPRHMTRARSIARKRDFD